MAKDLQLNYHNSSLIPMRPGTNIIHSEHAEQIADDLVGEAMHDLAQHYHDGQIAPELVLSTALGSKKIMSDVEYRRFKMKQEREGVLTRQEAKDIAREVVNGLCGSIATVAGRHGANGDEFVSEVIELFEKVEEKVILRRGEGQNE